MPLNLDLLINVADRVPQTRAEGPGLRYALWVQGCPLRCPGCCNPEMLEFKDANWMPVRDVLANIVNTPDIEGVTFIGGEPFSQAEALAALSHHLRQHELSVMVFSGFTLAHLRREQRAEWNRFLDEIDLLVDGPYIESQQINDRRWIGSANQQVHFLSPRYRHMSEEEEGWDRGPNTVELRYVDGQIQINGFPHKEVGGLQFKREE